MKITTRKEKAGKLMADALIEWANMMYNHKTSQDTIKFVIARLKERLPEFVAKPLPSKKPETEA